MLPPPRAVVVHRREHVVSIPAPGSTSKRLKRMARVEDGGYCFALNDDLLLHIFASYLDDTADVLRCAATCRRWRRLVTGEAGFIICRGKPPSKDGRLVNTHAVGFFHQTHDHDSSPRLQFLARRYSSLGAVFDGDLLRNSRLMASRNGRLLLELRCGPRPDAGASLRLAVCNAVTNRVFVLPTLPDIPKHYACALLAAADLDGAAVHPLLRPGSAGYRVIVIYTRGGAMACRSCSSDANASWGPEGQVSHANIRGRHLLGEMGAGVAVGGSVFWLSGNRVVLGLRLDTLQGRIESPKWCGMHSFGFGHPYRDRRLVVLPDGRLGAVQVGRGDAGNFVMNVFARNDYEKTRRRQWHSWSRQRRWDWESVDLDALLPPSPIVASGTVKRMRLWAVCERRGLIFVAAVHGDGEQQQDMVLYVLNLEKKKVQLAPVRPGSCCFRTSSCSFQACDNMNLVAYLASLGA